MPGSVLTNKYAEGYPGRFYHAEAYGVNPETFRTDPEIIRQRTLDGAKILAERLLADDVKANGISVLTGGTDVHLVMVDLRNSEMDGQQGEDLLAACGITINRNTVPFDPRPASVASGLRIGTSALATRGFGPKEYEEVADIIGTALAAGPSADVTALKARATSSPKTSRSTPTWTRFTDFLRMYAAPSSEGAALISPAIFGAIWVETGNAAHCGLLLFFMSDELSPEVFDAVCRQADQAARAQERLAQANTEAKNELLLAIADALDEHAADIEAANALDMLESKENGMDAGKLDRLLFRRAARGRRRPRRAPCGHPARSGRRDRARIQPAQRSAPYPDARAMGVSRHDLRGPAERHCGRGQPVPQVRQCRVAARRPRRRTH